MSVANELSSEIAAALLRRNNSENAEALLEAAFLAHTVLQNLSAGERPRRSRKREGEAAALQGDAASAAP